MIVLVKKKTLYIFGVIFVSLVGIISNHFRSNFSRGGSLLVKNTANADIPHASCANMTQCDTTQYTSDQCYNYYCLGVSSPGDGCCGDVSDSSSGSGSSGSSGSSSDSGPY